MPTLWLALKKSLHCKSNPSEVHEPRARGPFGILLVRKRTCRSSCSKSIANLKDVIHGSRRQIERHASCSPRSFGSNEFLNPIAHEVVLSDSRCELKITGFGNYHEGGGRSDGGGGGGEMGSAYVGTLRPGTPGPRGKSSTPPRKVAHPHWECSSLTGASVLGNGGGANDACVDARSSSTGSSATFTCHRCEEHFGKWEGLEAHHQSKHAVTELLEGDSSRKIVEIICKASWLKSESTCGRLERVLKVHNMQNTLTQFEEYRELVKARASKLPKKHPRCLADGNELLRFYATTVYCSLGVGGSSNLCDSSKCNICRILRFGFSKKEMKGGLGMFTTSTSGRALESIQLHEDHPSIRKALLICRVIAGRVHKPTENLQNMASQFGFDSVAGKVGPYSSIEELYLLNTRALLPCFVVICKP
ncbi:uncharacterized protein LOC121992019 [Zingiber officinale]|uniref:C2H2-type domain-containing protein n=1 Tax=Zingiber officinale TaxID=94328 RepID=A0A8J5M761_ZINOF|nr:uncharacterized protein LOC121992019 [Zingiber officinale]KAG6534988.1 hypothetical protein ZIOFF_008902 [Zingiber officinale]